MTLFRCTGFLLLAFVSGLFFCVDVHAQKGRGKGHLKNNGSKYRAGANAMRLRPDGNTNSWREENVRGLVTKSWHDVQPIKGGTGLESRLMVEERKLEHRREIAEHLRRVGERNGNEQLFNVADRLEETAQQHYEKRLAKINADRGIDESLFPAPRPNDDLPRDLTHGEEPFATLDATGNALPETAGRLTGRGNAYDHQLLAEERKLADRMSVAEHLRSLGESQGDPKLLEASEHLEDMAFSYYAQRLSKISGFQNRFGLPPSEDP